MRRFYIPPGHKPEKPYTITGQDARHMHQVLRLRPSDQVCLFDGAGREYVAEIETIAARRVVVHILEQREILPESPVQITLAQALLKERKMDRLIRQVTELGITCWMPFMAARTIPQPDARRQQARHERWQTIAREALKQCRRSYIPEIIPIASFGQVLQAAGDHDAGVLCWESGSAPLDPVPVSEPKRIAKVLVVLGPEGGFSPEEAAQAQDAGLRPVSLGPRTLRAETATVAACTLVQFLYGDMGKIA